MSQVIINLLTLKALSTCAEVYVGLAFVWLLMLGAGLGSVISRHWPLWLTLLWSLVLICLPVVGLLLYCGLSLLIADYSAFKMLGLGRKHGDYYAASREIPPRSKTES